MSEYEYEPVRGLPEQLPEGEYIVWQGEPEWEGLARRVFHVRGVALYFLLLMTWYLWSKLQSGASLTEALAASSWPFALGLIALGILLVMAWLYARSTVYTLTNKRIVLRFGVAIPMMINVPLERIEAADIARYGSHADICLTLAEGDRISFMALWPNARPWHYGRVKPALRGLANADTAAALLADVVGASARPAESTREVEPGFAGVVSAT